MKGPAGARMSPQARADMPACAGSDLQSGPTQGEQKHRK